MDFGAILNSQILKLIEILVNMMPTVTFYFITLPVIKFHL